MRGSAHASPNVTAYCFAAVFIVVPRSGKGGRRERRPLWNGSNGKARSEAALAAGIAAHLQANVRVRILPDALAAYDHVVGGSGRSLGEDRGDESGVEGHGGDQGLHVASPLRMLVRQSAGCIDARPGGQRLLTVKCHRHLRAGVTRITVREVSSRCRSIDPNYWSSNIQLLYIFIL